MKFSNNKTHELRHSLTNNNESISENYVCELHYDIDWVNFAMHAIIREYKSGSLKSDHLEQWYNIHLWESILDQCFANIGNMEAIHGEFSSLASALRKNLGCT